jgi:hypothetical protein
MPVGRHRAEHQEDRPAAEQNGPHTPLLLLQALVSAYNGQLRRYQQLATANSD